ncbi:MAG: T9SS type A sorting domain-containing protein [candidate division Zixibacteria bacterium]|nr:T9SS type A sorting domain-containing protein [candidate division Zixibacteria bacterium]
MLRFSLLFVFLFSLFSVTAFCQIVYNTVPDWTSNETNDYGTGCDFDDTNGDGFLDLAVSNGNDIVQAPNYIYINDNGVLPNSASWLSDDYEYSGHCEIGDLNGDGFPELMNTTFITPGWEPGWVQVYSNNDGEVETTASWLSEDLYSFRATLGDADGDGDLDLAVASGEAYNNVNERNMIYYNVDGQLQDTPGWLSDEADHGMDAQFVDIDNDYDLDLAVLTSGSPVKIYYNNNGTIETSPGWQSATSDNGNSFDFADLNGDGYLDLGVGNNTQLSGSGKFKIYFSENGTLHTEADWVSSQTGYGSEAIFSDVDNDGDQDFITGYWWGYMAIYLNNDGSFNTTPDWNSAWSSVVENVAFGDVDNGAEILTFETFEGDGQRKLFYLSDRHIQAIPEVVVDGQLLPRTEYCYYLKNGWVSLATAPDEHVTIYYRTSNHKDMAVSNWDDATYIYTNTTPDPDLIIGMIPNNPPIEIPAGGSFRYRGTITNKTNQTINTDVWIMLDVPGIGMYGPIQQFNNVPLQPNQTLTSPTITQNVPGFAPLGTYKYIANCGDYPSDIEHSYSFEFTVTAPAGAQSTEWAVSRWFEDELLVNIPSDEIITTHYPNPFNARTDITFNIPTAMDVNLTVYNVMGQEVTTLCDGYLDAGYHSISWEAGNRSSGVYFYKLQIGEEQITRRMTLLK